MYLVYKLTCAVTGKSYIGITGRRLSDRWREHIDRARAGIRLNSRLHAAIRKYGAATFRREVLDRTEEDEETARGLERAYIVAFDTFENGYNANLGGHGLLVVPDEIRRKIAAAQQGKYIPPETRERMSSAKLGDPRCASHLGAYLGKGAASPRAKSYLIRFPDASEHVITGIRAFIREHGLSSRIRYGKGYSKGYTLLGRLND